MEMELHYVKFKKDTNSVLSFEDVTGSTIALFRVKGDENNAKFIGLVISPDSEVKFESEIPYGTPSYEGGKDLVNKVFAEISISKENISESLEQLLWRTGVIQDLSVRYHPRFLEMLR